MAEAAFGTYDIQVDSQGRIRLPGDLQFAVGREFFMTVDEWDNIVALGQDKWAGLLEFLQGVYARYGHRSDVVGAVKRIMAFAVRIDLRNNESMRFPLPERLKQQSGIDNRIVAIGLIDHIMLAAPERVAACASSPAAKSMSGFLLRGVDPDAVVADTVRRDPLQDSAANSCTTASSPAESSGDGAASPGAAGSIPAAGGEEP